MSQIKSKWKRCCQPWTIFFPSGNGVIFSSNLHDPKERDLDLYSINSDGLDLQGIAFFNGFNWFPIFSPNRKYIVLAFNRNKKKRRYKSFFAEWNYK